MQTDEWVKISQVAANFANVAVAIGAIFVAIAALRAYWQNTNLERAKWALHLYEKFFEQESLKKIRDTLDCEAEQEQVTELVLKQQADFTDYLNFFEFVAFLESNKQLKRNEVEALFDYYLKCLKRHQIVRRYIQENGYEQLDKLLENWK